MEHTYKKHLKNNIYCMLWKWNFKTPLENKKKKDSSLKTFACFQFSTFAKTFISPTNKYSCYFSFHSSF